MSAPRRRSLRELSVREFTLYRVICSELEDLQGEIMATASAGRDLAELAIAMQDRRLLVQWLRDLRFPPASLYADSCPNEAMEDRLLREAV